jgi:hypothetical protein
VEDGLGTIEFRQGEEEEGADSAREVVTTSYEPWPPFWNMFKVVVVVV